MTYAEERKRANARPHRRNDLEAAILNLQLGPLAGRVHTAIDRHLAELPPVAQQTEFDRIWRLALHRMDLRQYTAADDTAQASTPALNEPPHEDEKKRVVLTPRAPDPDIQEMVDQERVQLPRSKRPGLSSYVGTEGVR